MKAIKFFLLLSLAFSIGFGWVRWRGNVHAPDFGDSLADEKGGLFPFALVADPTSDESKSFPPKLNVPDSINATIDPDQSSPKFYIGTRYRRNIAVEEGLSGNWAMSKPPGVEDSFEFNDTPRRQINWQIPPRLHLKPAGISTPFSKPDWYDHSPLSHPMDRGLYVNPSRDM